MSEEVLSTIGQEVFIHGIEEPNALVQIIIIFRTKHKSNYKKIYEGMEIESQNRWPSLENDFGSINNLFSQFLLLVFYKTFMGPHKKFWKNLYEPLIRRAAGLGKPPKDFKGISNHIHHNVDVTIIGGGLNGLLAAKSFINSNYDVL